MIALVVAAVLYVAPPTFTPGPDDPVCEAGQSVQVDHCAQGQLPGETAGRESDPTPATSPAAVSVRTYEPVHELAQTGVPVAPYVVVSVVLVAGGAVLRRVAVRRR